MEELLRIFNTDEHHILIDAISQKKNGMTDDESDYTYTAHVVSNCNEFDVLATATLWHFETDEIAKTTEVLKQQMGYL